MISDPTDYGYERGGFNYEGGDKLYHFEPNCCGLMKDIKDAWCVKK